MKWRGTGAEYESVEVAKNDFSAYVGMARADESVQLLLKKWKEAAESKKGPVEQELRDVLKEQFEARLARHQLEVRRLEEKVQALREQLQRRREKQQDIIDFRLEQLLRGAQGLGWTPDQPSRAIGSGIESLRRGYSSGGDAGMREPQAKPGARGEPWQTAFNEYAAASRPSPRFCGTSTALAGTQSLWSNRCS